MATSHEFMGVMSGKVLPIVQQLNKALQEQVERNHQKLILIISTIMFWATHDSPVCGEQPDSGVFNDLLDFRVEAGDTLLQEHFASSPRNAEYTLVRV